MASQLDDPPPSPALPAEGRESESRAIMFPMTTNERLHPVRRRSLEAVGSFNRVGNAPRVERRLSLFCPRRAGRCPRG